MNKGVTAPMLYVKTKDTAEQRGITYCANHIAFAVYNGKWCLTWISSGHLSTIPVDRIESIVLEQHGATFCAACDAPQSWWPSADPAYGPSQLSGTPCE